MGQGAREHGAVDAARRRPGDDIHHHAQLDFAADLAQQLEIDFLGVVFGPVSLRGIEEGGLRAARAVGDCVQGAGSTHELEDLLADAVHVDGERNAAEANQRNAEFLLAHEASPNLSRASKLDLPRLDHSIVVAVSIHAGL